MAQSALRDISPTWWKDIKPQAPQKPVGQQMSDVLGGMALATAPIPVVGDLAGAVSDAAMYAAYPEERTMLNAGMSLAGLVPFVPGAAVVRAAEGALDMSQAARMQRATEMGFEPQTYYHGTNTGFDSFDPTKADPSRRGTIFMSDNPAVASTYATIAGSKNVMPLMIRPERPIQVYASGANWNKLQGDTVVDLPARVGPPDEYDVLLAELRGTMPPTSKEYPAARSTLKELFPEVFAERLDSNSKMNTNDLSRWAQYQGADSLIFHDIIDTGPTFLKNKKAFQPSKNVVMFEPEKIRSIYADFNPAKRSSANLSAGIMGGAIGLSALRNINQQEEK